MSKQFNTQLEMMQDTINYYWNKPERQNLDSLGKKCIYSSNGISEGCAIGRLLDKDLCKILDIDNHTVMYDSVLDLLPEWMKNLGIDFLFFLQKLHDNGHFIGNSDENKNNIKRYINHTQDHLTFKFEDLTFPNE